MRATGLADGDIPAYWRALGLPGLADIHIHFLPQPMLEKVWAYVDEGERNYGLAWPVHYRVSEPERLELLLQFGVRAIPSLAYPHKPGMAQWLNDWCSDFAQGVPEAVLSATFYLEDGVGDYVRAAVEGGTRLFQDACAGGGVPARRRPARAGPGCARGRPGAGRAARRLGAEAGNFTGPEPLRALLRQHPRLVLVIAHLGMREYHEFADLAGEYAGVHLDTTMAGTDYVGRVAPLPKGYLLRLADSARRSSWARTSPTSPTPTPTSSRHSSGWTSATTGWGRSSGAIGSRLLGLS